ncbi:MAG: CoA transferase [Chloroflexi bacterium]|nr:CoA transferase [Chloroflexota bacterium]
MELPFKGVRVLDWGQGIDAPFCAKLLAALGADVIKIEPLEGDSSRRSGPFPQDIPHPERSGLFLFLNTGKQGITLNATSATGQELLLRLVARADVLVENFPPNALQSSGLSRDAFLKANPRLVLTSVTPFGLTGPYKDYLASELGVHALSAELSVAGLPDRPPLKKGGEIAQYLGGLHAFIATVASCYKRQVTGKGEHNDVSLSEGVTSIIGMATRHAAYLGKPSPRRAGMGVGPTGVYPTKDGYMVTMTRGGSNWQKDFEDMMREGGAPTEVPTARGDGGDAQEPIQVRFYRWMEQRTKDEMYHLAQKRRQAFGPVVTAPDLLASEQLQQRGYFERVEHPAAGPMTMMGLPFLLNGERSPMGRAPLLGEHNEAVYSGLLGLSRQDLVTLRQVGVA